MKTRLNKRSVSYIALFLILVFVPFMVSANKPPEKRPGGFELSLSQSILFGAIKKYGKPVQNVELNKYHVLILYIIELKYNNNKLIVNLKI